MSRARGVRRCGGPFRTTCVTRMLGVNNLAEETGFAAWDDALPLGAAKMLPNLVKDCEACFRARITASSDSAEYSHGTTHYHDANAQPRCLLEQLVFSILHSHIKDHPDLRGEACGAEWWTLAIDVDDEVGFHFDKDCVSRDRNPLFALRL